MRLTDDELREVLSRAEEIQQTTRDGSEMSAELEAVITAAEAVGLTRRAVERALREQLHLSTAPPVPGTLTFAPSVDGNAYVAEVVAVDADGVRVRFLRGSEHVVTPDQLRPCTLLPGERVVCNWPWWGPWTCTVVGYDPASRYVELSDGWGSTHVVAVAEVWQASPRKVSAASAARRRGLMLMGMGAGLGALVGAIVTALLMR